MAPIRPTISFPCDMSELQEDLVKTNLQIKMLNEEFAECTSEKEMEELNKKVRTMLAHFREQIQNLQTLAKDQKKREDQDMLLLDVENHQSELSSCQKQFKDSNLKCILRLQRAAKDDLFFSGQDSDHQVRRRRSQNREALVNETGQVTDNLTAISRQLAATVERSARTVEDLAESSQTVGETQDEFKNMGSVIGQSRKLITKYGRRETTDKVLIFFAFAFFFACVFYVLRKRLVLGPFDPFALTWNFFSMIVTTFMSLFGL